MSRPMTPPAGLASGAHCLPACTWSTRRQTAPCARASPRPQTQRHPSSVHATHTGTAVSPSRVCHRGVRGLSAVQHALRPRQPGAPNPVESHRAMTMGLGVRGWGGGEFTSPKPNPLSSSPLANPSVQRQHLAAVRLRVLPPRPAAWGHETFVSSMLERERETRFTQSDKIRDVTCVCVCVCALCY